MQIEDRILKFIENIGDFNFDYLIYFVGASLFVLWLLVVYWVWSDSRSRFNSIAFSIIAAVLVLPVNIPMLIIYLIIRPSHTMESLFWSDLERRFLIHETADLGDCKECGYQLSPEFDFCPQCAKVIRESCDKCETMVKVDWKFCPKCGDQKRQRALKQQVLSEDVMQKNLDDSREMAEDAVAQRRIRYDSNKSIAARLGQSVIRVIMGVGRRVDAIMKGISGVFKSRARRLKGKASVRNLNLNEKSVKSSEANVVSQKNEDTSSEDVANVDNSSRRRKKRKKKRRR